MANTTGQTLINFEVFAENIRLPGLVDVELPTIAALSETIKGAGIAGEIDCVTLGHYGPMAMTLKWRVTESSALLLAAPRVHNLELRGAIQRLNSATGILEVTPVKLVTRCQPKSIPLGTLAPAAAMEPSAEFSVLYLKVFLNGRATLEIDPLNYVSRNNGVDYLATTRSALGL